MSGFIGIIPLVVVLFLCRVGWAANPYQLGKVDYFHEQSMGESMRQANQIIDWREPIIGQDGKVTYYQPPAPVLALLENPTEENAQAYVDWQNAKTLRIQKAQEALNRLSEQKI